MSTIKAYDHHHANHDLIYNSSSALSPSAQKRSCKDGEGDRFIPCRSAMDLEVANFSLFERNAETGVTEFTSPAKEEYRRKLAENLLHEVGSPQTPKILAFKRKPSSPSPADIEYPLYDMDASSSSPPSARLSRHIPLTAERILDAPELMDDYYLNLLDWSCRNILAVALGSTVYFWNGDTCKTSQLMSTDDENDHITSVSWAKDGNLIAVGVSNAEVHIWDAGKVSQLRKISGHCTRVGSLAWNEVILTTGSRDGMIINHDVRAREHRTSHLTGHFQEVCGLRWSPSGQYLASGGNDNLLHVWDWAAVSGSLHPSPPRVHYLHRWNDHLAAVKALAWCPFQPSLLASGGGTTDRCIKFWNINNGTCINSIDTGSQVCALQWSIHHREMVSSHGYSQNQLCVWKYPSMTKMAELKGHTARVLYLAQSPDGSTVVSGAADETLRFWKVFCPHPRKKSSIRGDEFGAFSLMNIR